MGIDEPATITRPFFLPPGTPKEQVQMLRTAFQETLKDPALLEEANKAKLEINPMTGDQIGEVVKRLFDMKPSVRTKLKEILFPSK
jgi:tripartite-type tricarboxylate transporter receptor subunit TctC